MRRLVQATILLALLLTLSGIATAQSSIPLHSKPDSGSNLVYEFTTKIDAEPRRRFGTWLELEMPDGRVGWMDVSAVDEPFDLSEFPEADAVEIGMADPSPDPSALAAAIGGLSVLFVLASISGSLLYFLPTIIATARQHRFGLLIFLTNLLLGWTVIFWLVALAISIGRAQKRPAD